MFEKLRLDIKWDVVILTIILGAILFILSFNIMNRVNSPRIELGMGGGGNDLYKLLANALVSLFVALVLGIKLSALLLNLWYRLIEKSSAKKK